MADLTLDPSLGMPFVHLVDDAEEVVREALAWLLHSRRLPLLPVIFLTGPGDVPTTVAAVKGGSQGAPDGR